MSKVLDFIEVGTANFDTIIQECSEDARGISIEPLKFYLDDLPNKPNVQKLAVALVPNPTPTIDFYYIHPDVLEKHQIYGYMKGCNSAGKPHDFHLDYTTYSTGYVDENTPHRNLLEEGLVTVDPVPALTYKQLMKIYGIDYVDRIKLDTEGQDAPLLQSILNYYIESGNKFPKTIEFETNHHNNPTEVLDVIFKLLTLNYDVQIGDSYYGIFRNFDGSLENDCIATLKEN